MKIFLDIFRYLLSGVLAISIFIIFICNTAISTVLSEGYIISKVSQSNYYRKIYEDFNVNCSKYIMQSGFDESVLNDICDISKIEQDTNFIIGNIYYNKKNEIETETIKSNLRNNINDYLIKNNLYIENDESVNTFINIISDEYINTIFHTDYESKANEYIERFKFIIRVLEKYAKYSLILTIILVFIIDIKFPSRNISIAGMSFLLVGLVLIYVKHIILKNVDIEHIFILNQPFSDMLKLVINEILTTLVEKYKVFNSIGIILIIFGNILQYENIKKKDKNTYRLYLPDVK